MLGELKVWEADTSIGEKFAILVSPVTASAKTVGAQIDVPTKVVALGVINAITGEWNSWLLDVGNSVVEIPIAAIPTSLTVAEVQDTARNTGEVWIRGRHGDLVKYTDTLRPTRDGMIRLALGKQTHDALKAIAKVTPVDAMRDAISPYLRVGPVVVTIVKDE